jgi:hypothetical protein
MESTEAAMSDKAGLERLLYLDTDFISKLYEGESGVCTATLITRTQSLEAKASITLFSGGGTTSESRSYSISALQMLSALSERMGQYPSFEPDLFKMGDSSGYFWVKGVLGVTKIKVTRFKSSVALVGEPGKSARSEELVGEDAYFSIRQDKIRFALSPNDEYFSSGVAALKGMAHLVIDRISLPCSALVRVFSAHTSADEWVATPLVIYDGHH